MIMSWRYMFSKVARRRRGFFAHSGGLLTLRGGRQDCLGPQQIAEQLSGGAAWQMDDCKADRSTNAIAK